MCLVAQNYTTNVARVYYNDDVTGVGTWTLKQTFDDVFIETIHHVASEANGWAVKSLPQAGGPTNAELHHTDDNWSSFNTITISAAPPGDPRFDVDDFGLGIFVVGKFDGEVKYTTSYTDTTMTALTGITANGSASIRFVRIPFKKILSQEDNDDPNTFMFIIGSENAVGGETIWAVTFDSADGSVVNEENLTPVVSATTYYGRNRYSFSAAGGNSQNMLLDATPVGDTSPTKRLLSEDGGGTWQDLGSNAGNPSWLEGSDSEVMFASGGNINYSGDKGVTLVNQTGNLSDANVNKALIIPS
jgi:hypothetical protein